MTVDSVLSQRLRDALHSYQGITEKQMMGGMCFFINGNMVCGADRTKEGNGRFMFRVGKENQQRGEALPDGKPMYQGNRLMSGFFFVSEEKCTDKVMGQWVSLATEFARGLPPK